MIRKILLLLCVMASHLVMAQSENADSVFAERAKHIKASIIAIEAGNDAVSMLGHTALRLQLAEKKLDYCFSVDLKRNILLPINFPAGEAKWIMENCPTELFFKNYKDQGRKIEEYDLNLTPKERQQLWRLADEKVGEGDNHKFSYKSNCTSVVLLLIQEALVDEYIDWKGGQVMYTNGCELTNNLTRNNPWARFFLVPLLGFDATNLSDVELMTIPENLPQVLRLSTISQFGKTSRPLITGKRLISPSTHYKKESMITPTLLSLCLLSIVIIVSLLQVFSKVNRLSRMIDIFLLFLQTFVGCQLIYCALASGFYEHNVNPLLIVMNPLPLLAIIFLRKRYPHAYLWFWRICCVIVALFIISVSVQTQLQSIAMLSILFSLLIRCIMRTRALLRDISC